MNSVRFPTTAWTLIREASRCNGDELSTVFNSLAASYWRPVFLFIRRHGWKPHEAEDLTQEFFLLFLSGKLVGRAEQSRGRFRNLLLRALSGFLADQSSARVRRQVAFERNMVSIASLVREAECEVQPTSAKVAESLFMRDWAESVIAVVSRRIEQWCREKARPEWARIFELAMFSTSGQTLLSTSEVAVKLGITRDQVRYAQEVLSRQFQLFLRDELVDQSAADADIDDELRMLLAYLGR